MTHSPDTPATPEGDAISRALPNAYYECAGCTQQGSEGNCRPAEEIRLAPDETWLCEYCYDDAAYECGEDANWPVWADLPKLSAALTAQPVAQERRSFPDAADGRPMPPMGDDLMTAGLNGEDARFVAIQLAQNGLSLVSTTPAPVEAGLLDRLDGARRKAFALMDALDMRGANRTTMQRLIASCEDAAIALRAQSAPAG